MRNHIGKTEFKVRMKTVIPDTLKLDINCLREAFKARRYLISEHVIRFLMAGFVSLPDIETVIQFGRVIKNQTNANHEESVIIQGQVKDRNVFLLASMGSDGYLLISLVYLRPYPTWPQLICAKPNPVYQMENLFRSCFFCGGNVKAITVGNFDYRYEGALYVIKDTPAGLCLKCGEKYLTAETAEKINSLITAGEYEGTEHVNVVSYKEK
jgi:YgiT-type zinc finger domain-containing protein